MIEVIDAAISAVLIGGEWVRVNNVVVDFAQFRAAGVTITGRGQYLSATIQGGPNNGQNLVAALSRIDAVRV